MARKGTEQGDDNVGLLNKLLAIFDCEGIHGLVSGFR
jgi:hypothetical protein